MTRENRCAIGVDVGGTKIAAAVVDSQGRIKGRVQRPTALGAASLTLAGIADTIRETMAVASIRPADIVGVGLGIPGKVDPTTGVGVLSVNLGWRDAPVVATLEAELGLPCAIENDVSVGALGESRYGRGRGAASLVYLIIGTGVAARVVIDGRLYRGVSGMAGEIGHTVFDPHGPLCKCGARGCLEAIASGPGLVVRTQAALAAGRASRLGQVDPEPAPLTPRLIFEAADQDDELAVEVIEDTGRFLGQAVAQLIMVFDPTLVVLGGGLAQAGPRLVDAIHRELAHQAALSYVFRDQYRPDKVQVSRLGADVALLGAAALIMPRRVVDERSTTSSEDI